MSPVHALCSVLSFLLLLHAVCGFSTSSRNGLPKLVIGTRGSPLALAQAYETKRRLVEQFPELNGEGVVEIRKIMTKGDSILNQALSEIGGKGLFTKELDVALVDKEVDICVHSLKDVPTILAEGTELSGVLPREETNDVFLSSKYKTLQDLPNGARIGSASLRRQAQLLSINPTFQVVNFRGNVQTRLKKLDNEVVDATLLALAGLKRLEMHDVLARAQVLSKDVVLPAVAQGAIGLQTRCGDERVRRFVEALNDPATQLCVQCERAFLYALDGNCRTPIAAQAQLSSDGSTLTMKGFIAKPDGQNPLRIEVQGTPTESEKLGRSAGDEVRRRAGARFVEYQQAVQMHQQQLNQ